MDVSDHIHTLVSFTPKERALDTHLIGDWVGPRDGLSAVAKRKIPNLCLESDPRRLALSVVTILTEIPRLRLLF